MQLDVQIFDYYAIVGKISIPGLHNVMYIRWKLLRDS